MNPNIRFFHGVCVTTEKNIRIYYTKAPVVIFGLLFPLFMFLSFYMGREINLYLYFPGLLAMSLFFTASSVGPLITPWEKQAGTYERLLSFPVSINTIILGDISAGMVFGIMINTIVFIIGMIILNYIVNFLFLIYTYELFWILIPLIFLIVTSIFLSRRDIKEIKLIVSGIKYHLYTNHFYFFHTFF